jgi:RecA-family ATPase
MEAPAEAVPAQPAQPPLAERLRGLWRTVADAGDWLSTDAGPPEWLLKRDGVGWLRRGIVGLLVGGGGTGKTMAALQLAVAVAGAFERGSAPKWFGLEVSASAREGVLVLLGEEPEEEAHRRCRRAALASSMRTERLAAAAKRLVVVPLAGEAPALRDGGVGVPRAETALVDALKELLKKPPAGCTGWSLVVVDPLSRFGGPDAEVDNAAATELVTTLEAIRRAAPGNPTLLVVHHKGKAELREGNASQTGARGASALVDGARWVADLSRERMPSKGAEEWTAGEVVAIQAGRRVRLEVVKSNYSAPGPPVRLAVAQENEWFRLMPNGCLTTDPKSGTTMGSVPAGALVLAKYQHQSEAAAVAAENDSAGKASVVEMMTPRKAAVVKKSRRDD